MPARHLANHSYDTRTLSGMPIKFVDGCDGMITGASEPFARVTTVGNAPHHHSFEYAWETVAWAYVDKNKAFPIK